MTNSTILELTENYLKTEIAAIANECDRDSEILRSALQGLAVRNLLALRVPKVWNGAGFADLEFSKFQEQIARYSGALAFLQTQHQSAGAILVKSDNEALKQQYLPFMGSGEKLVGIGFSHLRRTNSPLKALRVEGGYQLYGQVPWITGCDFFQTVLLAALLPDGRAVYGMVPLTNRAEIHLSEPMPLAAMTSTNTITAEITNYVLPDSDVAFIVPAGAIHKSDRTTVLNHSFFALGCAQAGLDVVASIQHAKPFLTIPNTLSEELDRCRQSIYTAADQPFETKLTLRAWAIDLAVRCAHAAVIVSSGAANSLNHPAQRIYREALVFSVAGQTIDVLQASLDRLMKT